MRRDVLDKNLLDNLKQKQLNKRKNEDILVNRQPKYLVSMLKRKKKPKYRPVVSNLFISTNVSLLLRDCPNHSSRTNKRYWRSNLHQQIVRAI